MRSGSDSGFHFIQDYRKCERFFRNRYKKLLVPIKRSPAVIRGSAAHAGLELYYATYATSWQERTNAMVSKCTDDLMAAAADYDDPERHEHDVADMATLLSHYGMKYARDAEDFPEVVAIEQDVSFEHEDTGDIFTGRVDLVLRSRDGYVYIVDHKTTGWQMNALKRSLSVSDQATGYILAWNNTHPDMPCRGMIFNILRMFKTPECDRLLVIKTPEQVDRFRMDTRTTLNEIAEKWANDDYHWTMDTERCYDFNSPCPYFDECHSGVPLENLIGTRFKIMEQEDGEAVFYGESVG